MRFDYKYTVTINYIKSIEYRMYADSALFICYTSYIPQIFQSSQIVNRVDYQDDVMKISDSRPKSGGCLNIWT